MLFSMQYYFMAVNHCESLVVFFVVLLQFASKEGYIINPVEKAKGHFIAVKLGRIEIKVEHLFFYYVIIVYFTGFISC